MLAELAPETLLAAYAAGIFPMADDDGSILWFAPDPRAIIELDALTVSRSLRSVIKRGVFEVTINRAFAEVIGACAKRAEGTWISPDIVKAYCELHRLGFGYSVETWQDGELSGGLYGVALGGAFFGESMFHRASDASKVALVWLVERMRERSFVLLDVQFVTEHLCSFGAVEISRVDYERRLGSAVKLSCSLGDTPNAQASRPT